MSQILQPGQHPETDELNAFVEHSLPVHEEKKILAHVATCADCRAIAYLASSALPAESTVPRPTATPKSSLSRWNLTWPAVVALACLVIVIVIVRHHGKSQATFTVAANLERAHPAEPANARVAELTPPKSSTSQMQTSRAMAALSSAASREGASTKTTSIDGLASGKLQDGLFEAKKLPVPRTNSSPVAGREFLGGSSQGPMRAAVSGPGIQFGSPARVAISGADSIAVGALPRAAGISSNEGEVGQNAFSPDNAPKTTSSLAANQQSLATPKPASTPPPLMHYSANQAVTVTNGVPTEPESGTPSIRAGAVSRSAQLDKSATLEKHSVLPSHLPVLSVISRDTRELAIDTVGALFRSEDSGVSWQPVPTQWKGRAVALTVTFSLSEAMPGKQTSTASSSKVAANVNLGASAQPSMFELTTNEGDLWISADGQIWKRK
jgi:hypothetical protein